MDEQKMNQIVNRVLEYKAQLEESEGKVKGVEVSREKFTFLLGGIAAFRKVPGIPEHIGYEKMYHCESEENKELVKEYLKKLFAIEDAKTLVKACYIRFSGSREYEQFMTFWKDAPMFDVNKLQPQGLKSFEMCKERAGYFYPVLEERGFYAWDISERINLCRLAAACGVITDEEFFKITDEWVRIAQVFYNSYEEYAISCLCGAVYSMARYEEKGLEQFLDLNIKIVEQLINHNGVWQSNAWYKPKEREWVRVLEKDMGCFITKRALEKRAIHFMYRAKPEENTPDSGWRFMYGNEDEEYLKVKENTEVMSLNRVCNFQPDILAYVHAQIGKNYEMELTGWKEVNKVVE